VPRASVVVETAISRSPRARQLEGLFDVPPAEKCRLEWNIDAPFEERPWNVGLIVGPSGSGKSTIARKLFPGRIVGGFEWKGASVIDDFPADCTLEEIGSICNAVGFSTIPAWLRPFRVLSNGEQFRVTLARALVETRELVVFDEFTSVVDRQVAKIASHAVQKAVRKRKRQFVAVTCHYDVEDWLQPDWVLDMETQQFRWRSLRGRPPIAVEIRRVDREAWRVFAPFHYMSAELHRAAECWCLFAEGQPAAFAGILFRPNARGAGQWPCFGISRLVTMPDWQGLGLAFVLMDTLGGLYRAQRKRLHIYPMHPAFVRAVDRSRNWALLQKPGNFRAKNQNGRANQHLSRNSRPCARFAYAGPELPPEQVQALMGT
jgi:ABC-type uncharacterized transport system YnjBCD ATPase subunit